MRTRYLFALLATFVALALAACSGGNVPIPTSISVSLLNQLPASLTARATTGIVAMVSNDGSNRGVNWTVTCGISACESMTWPPPAAPPSPIPRRARCPRQRLSRLPQPLLSASTKSVSPSATVSSSPAALISVSICHSATAIVGRECNSQHRRPAVSK